MAGFRKIHVLVEGQTEERIVNVMLQPEFEPQVLLNPVLVATRRSAGQPHSKGGVSQWGKIHNDIKRLLKDSSAGAVTTMLDYYGLPTDTPGYADAKKLSDPYARVSHVERAMAEDISDTRFVPFLALHETETWVLAARHELAELLGRPNLEAVLRDMVNDAGGAELVNDGVATAPSKRLLRACPGYRKTVDGPDAVRLLGLSALCEACPHFASWISRLRTC